MLCHWTVSSIGYDLIVKAADRSHAAAYREKFVLLLDALERFGYDHVYWKDTDVVLLDCDQTLEDLFSQGSQAHALQVPVGSGIDEAPCAPGNASTACPPVDTHHGLDALLTSDREGFLNSGNLFLRQSPWTRWLLRRSLAVFDEKDGSFAPNPAFPRTRPTTYGPPLPFWWDQTCLMYVLLGEPLWCRDSLADCLFLCQGRLRDACEARFPLHVARHVHLAPYTYVPPAIDMVTSLPDPPSVRSLTSLVCVDRSCRFRILGGPGCSRALLRQAPLPCTWLAMPRMKK